jgi:hypothetical protein
MPIIHFSQDGQPAFGGATSTVPALSSPSVDAAAFMADLFFLYFAQVHGAGCEACIY